MTNKRQKEYYKEKTRYWITTIDDFEDTPYTCAVIDETCRLIKLIEAHPELAEAVSYTHLLCRVGAEKSF